ncbi:MAG: hypothetical protein RLZZ492_297, partial [Pseudomonadota bacterium]
KNKDQENHELEKKENGKIYSRQIYSREHIVIL